MAHPETAWQEVKEAYESGLFGSIDAVYRELSKNAPKTPKIDAIKDRMLKDATAGKPWVKGKNSVDYMRKMFEHIGYGIPEHLQNIKEICAATTTKVIASNNSDPTTGQKEPGFVQGVPDYRTRAEGAKIVNKMIALEAPETVEHTGGVAITITIDGKKDFKI